MSYGFQSGNIHAGSPLAGIFKIISWLSITAVPIDPYSQCRGESSMDDRDLSEYGACASVYQNPKQIVRIHEPASLQITWYSFKIER